MFHPGVATPAGTSLVDMFETDVALPAGVASPPVIFRADAATSAGVHDPLVDKLEMDAVTPSGASTPSVDGFDPGTQSSAVVGRDTDETSIIDVISSMAVDTSLVDIVEMAGAIPAVEHAPPADIFKLDAVNPAAVDIAVGDTFSIEVGVEIPLVDMFDTDGAIPAGENAPPVDMFKPEVATPAGAGTPFGEMFITDVAASVGIGSALADVT